MVQAKKNSLKLTTQDLPKLNFLYKKFLEIFVSSLILSQCFEIFVTEAIDVTHGTHGRWLELDRSFCFTAARTSLTCGKLWTRNPSIYLSILPSIYPSFLLSIHPSFYLSFLLSILPSFLPSPWRAVQFYCPHFKVRGLHGWGFASNSADF